MLSRIQQCITLGLLWAVGCWISFWWGRSVPWALAGVALALTGHSIFLGLEFALLRQFNRQDPAPRASVGQLLAAWWGESTLAPRVFCWRQPFRPNAVPDHLPTNGLRGVVLVHGFFCNRGLWTPWLYALRQQGHAFVAVDLEPVFGSIDTYAARIDAAVRAVTAATGCAPVLVCHSMGGLAARAWLRQRPPDGPAVHHVVTIGTPHHGTWLGRFSHSLNGHQMRLHSRWLQQLAQDEQAVSTPRGIMPGTSARVPAFTCWYSNCDNIVFPVSTATLDGADNRLLPGQAHVQLAFAPEILRHTLGLLQAPR